MDYRGNTTFTIMTTIALNGSIVSLNENGTAIPIQYANDYAVGLFSGFVLEVEYADSIGNFTSALQFHSTGTSTVTIGTVSIPVTTYTLNSSPETVSYCGGTDDLTAFTLSEGTPSGATIPLVTSVVFAGTGTSDGTTTTFNLHIQVTALTVS